MDWPAAADALIKVVREIGFPAGGVLLVSILLWKAMDAWGKKRSGRSDD